MSFSASGITGRLARKWSVGPVKFELQTFTCTSTDTSGSVTAKDLSTVDAAVLLASGTLCETSAPSISGTTVTLAFADPAAACTGYSAATINGYVLLIGS